MELIVTHDLTDFDGFASAVAARKLYPGATIGLGRRLSPALRDYLAIHSDRFDAKRFSEIDQTRVSKLIVVDVRRANRLKAFEVLSKRIAERDPTLEIHVYDHHSTGDDDLVATMEVVEPVGSATTLLVERIKQAGIPVDVEEATLFALGIYADTGSLKYPGTSGRDARAVGWLLDQGGNLKTLNRYLRPAYGPEERRILTLLLSSVEMMRFGGIDVGFANVAVDRSASGLGELTSHATEFNDCAALFALYTIREKHVQVVARSRSRAIDASALLRPFGGGGHASAAAAFVKGGNADELRAAIVDALNRNPPSPRRVEDVMSRPVRTVPPDLALLELKHSLPSWRHSGVPVVRDGQLIGIISRRDVERAERAGRLHLPVASCMSQHVKTTTPDTPLEVALNEMEQSGVGRLPVMRDGSVVGMLARSDLREIVLYGPMSVRSH